jgi:hypothetical protein
MVVNAEGKGLATTRSGDRQEEDRKGTTAEVSKGYRRGQNRGGFVTAGLAPTKPAYGRRASGMRGGLSLPKRRLNGTWEPETAMLTERPQVEEPRGREYGSVVSGSDCLILVKKWGNSRGAKGAGHPRPNQFRSTGNRRNRAVMTEGYNLQWVSRAV